MLILRSHPQINMSQEVIQGQKSALQLVHLGAFLPSPIWALPAKGLKVLAFSLACLQEAVSSWGCVIFFHVFSADPRVPALRTSLGASEWGLCPPGAWAVAACCD